MAGPSQERGRPRFPSNGELAAPVGSSRADRVVAGDPARPFHSGELAWEEDEAHGAVLLQGMPVLWFNPNEMTFEHRVIKVDKDCSVLLIIAHEGTISNGSVKEDVLGVRISSICSIWETSEALRICSFLSIGDSHLNADTAVVVQASKRPMRLLKTEDVHIFLQAPRQRLKLHLEACIGGRCGSSGLEDRSALGGTGVNALGAAHVVRVDGFRLLDNHKCFDQDMEDIIFEVTQVAPSKTLEWSLPGAAPPSAADSELLKLVKRLGPIAHIDHARMSLVVHEVAALRQWFSVLSDHDHIDADIRKMLQDKNLLHAMVKRNHGFEAAFRQVQSQLEDHSGNSGFELNGSAAVRTVALGMRRFFELEIQFADLAQQLHADGLTLPHCVTLSGMLVEPDCEATAETPRQDALPRKLVPVPLSEVAKRTLNLDKLPDKARYGLIDMPDSSRSLIQSARSLLTG